MNTNGTPRHWLILDDGALLSLNQVTSIRPYPGFEDHPKTDYPASQTMPRSIVTTVDGERWESTRSVEEWKTLMEEQSIERDSFRIEAKDGGK